MAQGAWAFVASMRLRCAAPACYTVYAAGGPQLGQRASCCSARPMATPARPRGTSRRLARIAADLGVTCAAAASNEDPQPRTWRHLTVDALTANLGAVVRGLMLPNVTTEAALELREVFRIYKVFFIHPEPTQLPLTPDDLVLFAEIFGSPNIYPRAGFEPGEGQNTHVLPVLQPADATTVPFGGAGWHTDTSYMDTPPFATLLYAVEAPPPGLGDTLFSDGAAAFSSLSAGQFILHRLSSLSVWHCSNNLPPRLREMNEPIRDRLLVAASHTGLQSTLRGLKSNHSSALRGIDYRKYDNGSHAESAKTPLEATHPAVRVHP